MKARFLLTLCLFLSFRGFSLAEEIVLKNGKIVQGNIIEVTPQYVKIDFHGVAMPYWIDEINTIDGKSLMLWRPANNLWGEKIAENLVVELADYTNQEFNISFKIPASWQILSKDSNSDYFNWLKGMMPAFSDRHLICFVAEDLAYLGGTNINVSPLPLVTLARQIDVLEGPDALLSANTIITKMLAGHKKRAEIEKTKNQDPAGISSEVFRNLLNEEIIRFPKLEASNSVGKKTKILYVTYLYSHIHNDGKRISTYVLVCGCKEEDSRRYIKVFDLIARTLSPLD